MMPLTQSQGQALAALLGQMRKDWSLPGINAALRKAATIGSFADVAVAATRCAATPGIRTPALIPEPGPHWHGMPAGSRLAPVMCVEHAAEKAGGCPECVKAAIPRPAGFVVPRPVPPKVWHAPEQWPSDSVERREIVRELADREVEK